MRSYGDYVVDVTTNAGGAGDITSISLAAR